MLSGAWHVLSAPFTPRDDNFVLAATIARVEGVRAGPLRKPGLANSADATTAVARAQALLNQQRLTGDGRAVGQAEIALKTWWQGNEAPTEVLFLRAEIKQRNHDFTNALQDLDLVLGRSPDHAEALVLKATICQVLGRYDAARATAFRLIRVAPSLLAMTTVADLGSLTGQAKSASVMLKNAIQSSQSTNVQERAWASTTLAQALLRCGEVESAGKAFDQALTLTPDDPYTLAAFADYLLACGKPNAVIALLAGKTGHDHLLLRLAEAEAQVGKMPGELEKHRQRIAAGFAIGKLRGVNHKREEARYALHLLKSPKQALALAVANWEIQKEPVDAEVLLESSLATEAYSEASGVLDWIRKYHWETPELTRLVEQFPKSIAVSQPAFLATPGINK